MMNENHFFKEILEDRGFGVVIYFLLLSWYGMVNNQILKIFCKKRKSINESMKLIYCIYK